MTIDIAAQGVRQFGVDLQLAYLGNLRSVRGLLRAREQARDLSRGFDVVHAQSGSACGLATAAVEGVPAVLSLRGNDWNMYSQSFGFLYAHTRLAHGMSRLALGRYDAVVCVSHRMAGEVAPFAPRARLVTIPSPIDLRRFRPVDRMEARARLGFPGNTETWVLFNAVSLDDPVKQFLLAKRAFDLANARAGGTLRLRVATKLPHQEVPLFTAACDLILSASDTEGWPNCVKEALACNVPFVSTDVSDLRDIAHEEPTCRVCDATADALAQGIAEALSARVAGDQADLRRHVERMRPDLVCEQLVGLYRGLVH